MTSTCK